jgi:pilus assembly protein Flp/PilA
MTSLVNTIWKLRIWKDTRGQDLLEYALIAGFIVMIWGTISLSFAAGASAVFSKVSSTLLKARG